MAGSQPYALPSPTAGWNARDDITTLQPNEAIQLVNVFPKKTGCVLRNGSSAWATGLGGSVQTLIEYSSITGTRKLIGFANGHAWDCTSKGAASSLKSGLTNNKWSFVHQTGVTGTTFIVGCNGADTPQKYDGTTWSDAVFTGVSTPANLIDVSLYKQRKYFVEKNTANIWFDNTVDQITGVLAQFAVGGLLRKGGYVVSAGSWTRDMGVTVQELFVILSSMGEVLVYQGGAPSTSDWQILGRFTIPQPIGARPIFQIGAEAYCITELGVFPLGTIIAMNGDLNQTSQPTDKIRNAFISAAQIFGGTFGWQGVLYPRGQMCLINVPISTTISEQYVFRVLDTDTSDAAWCRFTGMNAASWSLYSQNLYYGGTDGTVYKADIGTDDNGAPIGFFMQNAYTDCGVPAQKKLFHLAKPTLIGSAGAKFSSGVDIDYKSNASHATFSLTLPTAALWDASTSKWDVVKWDTGNVYSNQWKGVSGFGFQGAPWLAGSFKGVAFSISALNLLFEPGGIL